MSQHIESLTSLRLPALQARFAEVVGEPTRSPNKTYLIRRITAALAAQAEQTAPAEEHDTATVEDTAAVEDTTGELEDQDHDDTAQTAEPPTEETTEDDALASEPLAPPAEHTADADADRAPLSKLGVAELQQRYLEVVGRPTGSSHKRYLIWKIREAEKGRIPVGPRTRRSPSEPAAEHMVLPVRMETSLVERLDAARERLGVKSRMDLFRRALSDYLRDAGETELATAILPEA